MRGAGRVPIQVTPSSASAPRTRSPATSSPRGAATAAERPSRAAPTAVIAPPPGVRRSSAANLSSPSPGSDSSPTNVRSRNTGVATTRSIKVVREYRGADSPVTRALTASPERRDFSIRPRAPESATRDPKSDLLATRREHDRSRRRGLAQAGGDLEPRHVRQADIEQDDVGSEPEHLRDGRRSVRGRADHDEAVRLECEPRHRAERRVVVDDQDGLVQRLPLTSESSHDHGAMPVDRSSEGAEPPRRLRPRHPVTDRTSRS